MPNLIDAAFILQAIAALMLLLGHYLKNYFPASFFEVSAYGKLRKEIGSSRFRLPKAWFRHFYTFGAIYTGIGVFLAVNVYVRGAPVPKYVLWWLDLLYGKDREAVGEYFFFNLTAIQCPEVFDSSIEFVRLLCLNFIV